MPHLIEDTGLPTVTVGERVFPIGAMTIHQLVSMKNLVVSIVGGWRVKNAMRQAEWTVKAAAFAREQVAQPDDPAEDEKYNATLQERMQRELDRLHLENGVFNDNAGLLLDYLSELSERQITDIARILLDRNTDTRVTLDFVEEHFTLEWFTDALVLFTQRNNLAAIVKNLQRLVGMGSIQLDQPTSMKPAASTSDSSSTSPISIDTDTKRKKSSITPLPGSTTPSTGTRKTN